MTTTPVDGLMRRALRLTPHEITMLGAATPDLDPALIAAARAAETAAIAAGRRDSATRGVAQARAIIERVAPRRGSWEDVVSATAAAASAARAALALAVADLVGQHGYTAQDHDLLLAPWRQTIGPRRP